MNGKNAAEAVWAVLHNLRSGPCSIKNCTRLCEKMWRNWINMWLTTIQMTVCSKMKLLQKCITGLLQIHYIVMHAVCMYRKQLSLRFCASYCGYFQTDSSMSRCFTLETSNGFWCLRVIFSSDMTRITCRYCEYFGTFLINWFGNAKKMRSLGWINSSRCAATHLHISKLTVWGSCNKHICPFSVLFWGGHFHR